MTDLLTTTDDSQVETVATEVPVEGAQAQDDGQQAASEAQAPDPTEAITAKYRADMARTAKALQNLQGERDTLRAELEATRQQQATPEPAAPAAAPRDGQGRFASVTPAHSDPDVAKVLAGLQRDEDGNFYLGQNAYEPDVAEQIIEAKVRAARAETRMDAFEERQRTAAEEQQIRGLVDELAGQMTTYIGDLVASDKAIPEQRRVQFEAKVRKGAAERFDEARDAGEAISDELVVRAAREAFKAERDYLAFPAAAQAADNAAYAAQYPVRPGGGTGVEAPVVYDKLTRQQKDALADKAALRAGQAAATER